MSNSQDHLLGNKMYDILKYGVEVVLPGLGTLYFTLGTLWGLPYGDQIVGTCAAVALFLGLLVGYSRKSYDNSESKYDGHIEIQETEDAKQFALSLNSDPNDLDKQKSVIFKVDPK